MIFSKVSEDVEHTVWLSIIYTSFIHASLTTSNSSHLPRQEPCIDGANLKAALQLQLPVISEVNYHFNQIGRTVASTTQQNITMPSLYDIVSESHTIIVIGDLLKSKPLQSRS
jgi:hypothetical protein